MGIYSLWGVPCISPCPLARNVGKRHLPIPTQDLAIFRLCFGDKLLVRGCSRNCGNRLPSALREGFGTLL